MANLLLIFLLHASRQSMYCSGYVAGASIESSRAESSGVEWNERVEFCEWNARPVECARQTGINFWGCLEQHWEKQTTLPIFPATVGGNRPWCGRQDEGQKLEVLQTHITPQMYMNCRIANGNVLEIGAQQCWRMSGSHICIRELSTPKLSESKLQELSSFPCFAQAGRFKSKDGSRDGILGTYYRRLRLFLPACGYGPVVRWFYSTLNGVVTCKWLCESFVTVCQKEFATWSTAQQSKRKVIEGDSHAKTSRLSGYRQAFGFSTCGTVCEG